MFDIIGKRNWFFALSLPVTIPGLIFILLGPITGGKVGLQFAIDFTGGTDWQIKFEDPNVTPQQVKDAIERPGPRAPPSPRTAWATSRSGPRRSGCCRPPRADRGPDRGAVRLRGGIRLGERGPVGKRRPHRPRHRPRPPVGIAGRLRVRVAGGDREPVRRAVRKRIARRRQPRRRAPARHHASPATGSTTLPTTGKLGRHRIALEETLGPIAEQRSLSTVGAVVSQRPRSPRP